MSILVTGGGGFLGHHVTVLLQRGEESILTPTSEELNLLNHGRNEEGYWGVDGASEIGCYCTDNNVESIVHLAATCGGIGINKDNPGKFIYENLQMGINVLEGARLADVKKVVNVGTVCAYPKFAEIPFREDCIWDGYPEETNAPYGIAKKTIMEMGIAYSRQYGMNITNLVPANMAGEYDNFDLYSSHVIPALIRKFEMTELARRTCDVLYDVQLPPKNEVVIWGTGSASREFLDAKDCARAIEIALNRKTGADPINLGTGQEITIKELAELIKRIGGYKAEILWDNTKPDGQPRRSLDITRAKQVLRWEPSITLENTLRRTINWYRANE